MEIVEGYLDREDEEYEKPIGERAGKLAFVTAVAFLATLAAESAFDSWNARRKQTEEPQETN